MFACLLTFPLLTLTLTLSDEAVEQLGLIFNVPEGAKVLNADIRNDFAVAKAALKKAGMPSLKAVIPSPHAPM